MKFFWLPVLLFAAAALATPPADIDGTWKLVWTGRSVAPREKSVTLDLEVNGDQVTGVAHIGSWPGDAPITDGKISGDQITFTAKGSRSSSTGIPARHFEVTIHGNEMTLMLSYMPGGSFEYVERKAPE
jgi:hypothetical protein